jgi:hypothetical protein
MSTQETSQHLVAPATNWRREQREVSYISMQTPGITTGKGASCLLA